MRRTTSYQTTVTKGGRSIIVIVDNVLAETHAITICRHAAACAFDN